MLCSGRKYFPKFPDEEPLALPADLRQKRVRDLFILPDKSHGAMLMHSSHVWTRLIRRKELAKDQHEGNHCLSLHHFLACPSQTHSVLSCSVTYHGIFCSVWAFLCLTVCLFTYFPFPMYKPFLLAIHNMLQPSTYNSILIFFIPCLFTQTDMHTHIDI